MHVVRFKQENWDRFKTHGKKTTIRDHPLKPGLCTTYGGSRYNPVKLGVIEVLPNPASKTVKELNEYEAKRDGFGTLAELILELKACCPKLQATDVVYIHECNYIADYIPEANKVEQPSNNVSNTRRKPPLCQ